MRHPFIIVGIVALLTLLVMLGAFLFPIIQYGRTAWPNIEDPEVLVKECRTLASQHATGPLLQDLWPSSIRKLAPLEVMVGKDHSVEIIISTGGIGPRASYIVFSDDALANGFSVSEIELHKSAYKSIFKIY